MRDFRELLNETLDNLYDIEERLNYGDKVVTLAVDHLQEMLIKVNARYNDRVEELRQEAIEWQSEWEHETDLEAIEDKRRYFEFFGKRYGLLEEFEENGII